MSPSLVPGCRSQDHYASPKEPRRLWGSSAAPVSKKGQLGDKWSIFIGAAEVCEVIWPNSVHMGVIPQIVAPCFATLQVAVSWERWWDVQQEKL